MKQDEFGYPILCDLGSAVHTDDSFGGQVQAISFRSPEVILGAEWYQKIEIWSFGVLVSPKATPKIITANEYRRGDYSLMNACSAINESHSRVALLGPWFAIWELHQRVFSNAARSLILSLIRKVRTV
jgi:hypothetical protein